MAFVLFTWDKWVAGRQPDGGGRSRWRRIPERRLLFWAAVGGSPGAVLAQRLFRHKTLKEPFRTRLRMITAIQLTVLAAWALRAFI